MVVINHPLIGAVVQPVFCGQVNTRLLAGPININGGKYMPNRLEVYKCSICGNIVEVMHSGAGALVCCGENMQLMSENTVDAATEKHVPVIEVGNGTVTVKVGDVAHPMEDQHYIEWIEL